MLTENMYIKLWKAEIGEKSSNVQFSVSHKKKDDEFVRAGTERNGFVTTASNYITFIGKAHNSLKKHGFIEGMTVICKRFGYENWKDEKTGEFKHKLTMLEIEVPDDGRNSTPVTPAKTSKSTYADIDDDDGEVPF